MRVICAFLAAVAFLAFTTAAAGSTVTVRPGETLSELALRHGVAAEELARANGIADPSRLQAGTELELPNLAGGASAPPRPTTRTSYRVRLGDTLTGIARRHGTSVAALVRANGLSSPHSIAAGRRLRIPGSAPVATPLSSSTSGGRHRVRSGETLSAIAARYGISVEALMRANRLSDPNRLGAGRLLRLPGAAGAPTPNEPVGAASPAVTRLLAEASARHGFDPSVARAVAWQESGFRQSALSSAGALGVMQLMPGTADWVGTAILRRPIDRRDLADNIDAGVAYLAWLQRRSGGSLRRAVGSYYQGPGSMRRHGPLPETERYIASVLSLVGRV